VTNYGLTPEPDFARLEAREPRSIDVTETTVDPLAAGRAKAPMAKKQRSKVTNGRRMFVEGNGWSAWARRWRDLIELHTLDLGGDPSSLSEAQRSMIKRAATIEIELEQIEGRLSEGKAADLAVYATASSHLRRLLETLGLDRKARDVTPPVIEGQALASSPWSSPMRASLSVVKEPA
jgi:hypothetical protein